MELSNFQVEILKQRVPVELYIDGLYFGIYTDPIAVTALVNCAREKVTMYPLFAK